MTQQVAAAFLAAQRVSNTASQSLAKAAARGTPGGGAVLDRSMAPLASDDSASPQTILARARTDERRASKAMLAAWQAAKAANDALWALAYGTPDAEICPHQEGPCAAQPCRAALVDYDGPWPSDEGELQAEDRRALISPDATLRPDAGMTLRLDGVSWQIVKSRELAPAGELLLYICQVRP